jgi:hypothetical protein
VHRADYGRTGQADAHRGEFIDCSSASRTVTVRGSARNCAATVGANSLSTTASLTSVASVMFCCDRLAEAVVDERLDERSDLRLR